MMSFIAPYHKYVNEAALIAYVCRCIWVVKCMFLRRSLAQYRYIYFCRYISGSCPSPPPPHTKKLATLLCYITLSVAVSPSSVSFRNFECLHVLTSLDLMSATIPSGRQQQRVTNSAKQKKFFGAGSVKPWAIGCWSGTNQTITK